MFFSDRDICYKHLYIQLQNRRGLAIYSSWKISYRPCGGRGLDWPKQPLLKHTQGSKYTPTIRVYHAGAGGEIKERPCVTLNVEMFPASSVNLFWGNWYIHHHHLPVSQANQLTSLLFTFPSVLLPLDLTPHLPCACLPSRPQTLPPHALLLSLISVSHWFFLRVFLLPYIPF